MSRGSVSGLPSSSFFSGLLSKRIESAPTPSLNANGDNDEARKGAGGKKNLQSREIKPMIDKPAAMAARAARSIFGSAIARPNQRQMTRCGYGQHAPPPVLRPGGQPSFQLGSADAT